METTCGRACGTQDPIETLKGEHRVIERVLTATEQMLADGRIDRDFFTGMIDFVRNFADGCHHAKEEDQLFPALERAGVPRHNGPIGCMLDEHEQGRALIRTIQANLDGAARGAADSLARLRSAALHYIALLRHHIEKEDQVLFVMAQRLLDEEEHLRLSRGFDQAEHTPASAGKHERYLKLADELCRTARVAAAQPA